MPSSVKCFQSTHSVFFTQYTDYSYDNHQIGFKVLKKDLKSDRATALGFGAATTLSAMVPLLNIIAIPAAVCGGTAFYVERLKNKTPNNL